MIFFLLPQPVSHPLPFFKQIEDFFPLIQSAAFICSVCLNSAYGSKTTAAVADWSRPVFGSSPLQLTAGSAYWTRTIFSVSRDGAEGESGEQKLPAQRKGRGENGKFCRGATEDGAGISPGGG